MKITDFRIIRIDSNEYAIHYKDLDMLIKGTTLSHPTRPIRLLKVVFKQKCLYQQVEFGAKNSYCISYLIANKQYEYLFAAYCLVSKTETIYMYIQQNNISFSTIDGDLCESITMFEQISNDYIRDYASNKGFTIK